MKKMSNGIQESTNLLFTKSKLVLSDCFSWTTYSPKKMELILVNVIHVMAVSVELVSSGFLAGQFGFDHV